MEKKKKQKNVKLGRVTIVKEEKYGEYKESSRSQMVLVRVCQPQTVGIAGVTRPVSFPFSSRVGNKLGSEKKRLTFLLEKKKICSVGSLFYLRGVDTK